MKKSSQSLKIFIIAAEESGDRLGSAIIKGLRGVDPDIIIEGIGGAGMQDAGLEETLFPMTELSLMGIAEIVPKIPHMLKRINQTVKAIEALQPDIVITIDGPEFCFRVQKKLKNMERRPKQVHVVAPSVWAWRPGRAAHIAEFLDAIICLFPFEPPYFEKEGMDAFYMGHPFLESLSQMPDKAKARQDFGLAPNDTVIGVYCGSRTQEVKRHADIFLKSLKRLEEKHSHKSLKLVFPTLPHLIEILKAKAEGFDFKNDPVFLTNQTEKKAIFKGLDMALAVSGTVGLELALSDVPHVIGYKLNKLSYQIIKRLVRIEHAHLANIMLKNEVVPEYLQNECNVDNLYSGLERLLIQPDFITRQKESFDRLINILQTPKAPSQGSAEFILNLLNESAR